MASNQVPGRIWDGKDTVLAALAAVTKACTSALSTSDGARVVAALTEAAGRKKADFRQASGWDWAWDTFASSRVVASFEMHLPAGWCNLGEHGSVVPAQSNCSELRAAVGCSGRASLRLLDATCQQHYQPHLCRQAALAALETALTALSGQDHYAAATAPLLASIRQHRELAVAEATAVRTSSYRCPS